MGLAAPPGSADLEVDRRPVPPPGTPAHRAAFDAALALGQAAGAAPRGDAARDDAGAGEDSEGGSSSAGSPESDGAECSSDDAAAAPASAPAEPAAPADAAEQRRSQRAALAAAREELGLQAHTQEPDPAVRPPEVGGGGGAQGGGRAPEQGPEGVGAAAVAPRVRVVHLEVSRRWLAPSLRLGSAAWHFPCVQDTSR